MSSGPSRRCRYWRAFPLSSPRPIPPGGTGGSGLELLRRSSAWRSLLVPLTTSPRKTNNWSGCSNGTAPEMAREEMAEPLEIDEHLVTLLAPVSYEAEKYRTLAHTIELARKDIGLHVLAVTSPTAGDGKTTTAINLAGTLAQSPEARVLLVGMDLRRPSLTEHLGMADIHAVGLASLILDLDPARTLNQAVQHLKKFNLSVLPAGPLLADPYEVLKSPRLGHRLQEARHHYHY